MSDQPVVIEDVRGQPERDAAAAYGAQWDSLRAGVADLVRSLEDACGTKAAWDGLSPAQRQELARRGLLAVAKLARLLLRHLT